MERQAATRDRRIAALHDSDIGNSARGLGMGESQGEPDPIGEFPATVGDAHTLFVGVRRQSKQDKNYHGDMYGRHRDIFIRTAQYSR